MITRLQWMKIEQHEKLNLDFSSVKKPLFDFIRILNSFYGNHADDVKRILEAKRHLETAFISLKNLIRPEDNRYMKKYMEGYYLMLENLGRWNHHIDELSSKMVEKIDFNSSFTKREVGVTKLRNLLEYLKESSETLIMNPLISAKYRYDNEKLGDGEIKDRDLFIYYLFIEMLHTSEILGMTTRASGFAKKKLETTPPQNPEDIKKESSIEVKEGEDKGEAIASFLADSFVDEDGMD